MLASLENVDIANFISDLLPITLGNIVSGGELVAAEFWMTYLTYPTKKDAA